VTCDQLNSTSLSREVNRIYIDAKRRYRDSGALFLHPERRANIQTFYPPVSLIRLVRMAESLKRVLEACPHRYPCLRRRCCRETLS
jgi:hypothetical protein